MTKEQYKNSHKILPLDALRGIAAIVVLLDHFCASFLPSAEPRLVGTPYYAVINGYAAVMIFFILSGYVLSLKGRHADSTRAVTETAAKRWFRLAPLACVSTLLSYALFKAGLYHFEEAARFNGSHYLARFCDTGLTERYRPDIADAVYQGAVRAFTQGDCNLNASLWTMQWELKGSFLVLALALALRPQLRRVLQAVVIVQIAVVIIFFPPYAGFVPFLLGLFAASLPLEEVMLGKIAAICLLVTGICICSYSPGGNHVLLPVIAYPQVALQVLILTCGAWLIFLVFATSNFISCRFHGATSRMLGSMSFPLYLVHAIIFMSVSSWAYAALRGTGMATACAALSGAVVMVPLVWALSRADQAWLKFISRTWRALVKS